MQRMVPLFLIYLFLLTAILWIPAPYRLTREGFTTEFTLKALDKSPATAQAEAAAEAERVQAERVQEARSADAGPTPAEAAAEETAESMCREQYPNDSNNYCSLTNINIDNMDVGGSCLPPANCNDEGFLCIDATFSSVCVTRTNECSFFRSAYGCQEWNAALTQGSR